MRRYDRFLKGFEKQFKTVFIPLHLILPKGGFSVHPNRASCVLNSAKPFPLLKTTCPCRGLKPAPKSQFFLGWESL